MVALILIVLWITSNECGGNFYPAMTPSLIRRYRAVDGTGTANFRSLLLDQDGIYAYVGGRSSIYKLRLSTRESMLVASRNISSIKNARPNFQARSTDRDWWTSVKHTDEEFRNYPPIRDILNEFNPTLNTLTYKSVNLRTKLEDYLRDTTFESVTDVEGNAMMDNAQQYSTIYQSAKLTFDEHCQRQAEVLSLYYGNELQMSVDELESLCETHIRGISLMDSGKLFTIRTGIFGTMAVSATGLNKYSNFLRYQALVQPYIICIFEGDFNSCRPNLVRYPFEKDNYSGIVTDPIVNPDEEYTPNRSPYIMPSPENYLGKERYCDNTPAPNRVIFQSSNLEVLHDGILVGQPSRESCTEGSLAQLFLGGYHPDQKTFSHFSNSGNGRMGNRKAVYVLTEIGQEKQLDLMREYLNLPEIYPLSSSTSLAMVRLLIDPSTGDVDPTSIVMSNPFKYTWVTSPLNRFGRLNKVGSQEQVAYIPKPVGIHEDGDYIYLFFREADWENTPVPNYSIRRYHYNLNSYSHALYFPWEKSFIDRSYIKFEETPGDTYEELYAPDYMGWQHINNNLRVTGRVARVSKDDAGLPMGLQDANLFDLDHSLSLTTFQTFLKSRLTCRVPVAGVPFVWRLRKDVSTVANDSAKCFTEIRKAENLYGKDLHYRAVSRKEFTSIQRKLEPPNQRLLPSTPILQYYFMSHCKGYRWAYVPKLKSSTALYVEYTELRDFYNIGDTFYGVFSTPLANEQAHTSKSMPDSSFQQNSASAVCSFTMSDIKSTFDGPFKKRDKATGSFRPFGEKDVKDIEPNPHSRDQDFKAESVAMNTDNMTIEFLDPTQPYSEEIRHIDLRRNSSRVNFFEEDVYGTRTMWDDVKTKPLMSENGVVFENIVAQNIGETTMLYIATNVGTIYKISTSQASEAGCRLTDKTSYLKWLNKTQSMSSIWDNEFYAYFNRTVDSVTFAASFKSDLTMEKDIKFPDDVLLRSDWDCTPSMKSKTLAIFKPFGDVKTTIWDMKLTEKDGSASLVLVTDEEVLQIPTLQCNLYTYCTTCANDPQCSWSNTTKSCEVTTLRNSPNSICTCQLLKEVVNVRDDLILSGLNQPADLTLLQWYHNESKVVYQSRRMMLSYDTSLILFNIVPADTGIYELKNIETDECLASYQVLLTNCDDENCRYEMKYQEWCNQYDDFLVDMKSWTGDYKGFGFCKNLD